MSMTVEACHPSQVLAAVTPDRVLVQDGDGAHLYVRTPVGWRLGTGGRLDAGALVIDPALIAALDAAAVDLQAIPA